jgi:hypothetical protein
MADNLIASIKQEAVIDPVGSGTTFTITLPLAEAGEAT